jgi:DNA-binding beta-propeller fold protein YncE
MVPAPSGDLYVSDGYRNARVHRFAWDGLLKQTWGEPGKTAPGHFHLPHSLIVAHNKVYVCDRENHRIQVFTLEGAFIEMWTDIQRPMDISVDKEGILYVSEGSVNNSSARVSVLDTAGKVLARFPCRGPGHGSWVDSHGDIYVGLSNPGGLDKFVRQG